MGRLCDLIDSRLVRGFLLLIASIAWWVAAPYVLTWLLGWKGALLVLIFARTPAALLGLIGLVMVLGELLRRDN
jgi:hypothetical protein